MSNDASSLAARLEVNRAIRDDIIQTMAQDTATILKDEKALSLLLKAMVDSDKSLLQEERLRVEADSNDINREVAMVTAELMRKNPGRDILASPVNQEVNTNAPEPDVDLLDGIEVTEGEVEEYSEPITYEDFLKSQESSLDG